MAGGTRAIPRMPWRQASAGTLSSRHVWRLPARRQVQLAVRLPTGHGPVGLRALPLPADPDSAGSCTARPPAGSTQRCQPRAAD
eukprot:818414-Alexandrium_andersonii.AAC.1